MLTTGPWLSQGLAVPQGLETGQALRWLHGDFLHDSPERLTPTTHFKALDFGTVYRLLFCTMLFVCLFVLNQHECYFNSGQNNSIMWALGKWQAIGTY